MMLDLYNPFDINLGLDRLHFGLGQAWSLQFAFNSQQRPCNLAPMAILSCMVHQTWRKRKNRICMEVRSPFQYSRWAVFPFYPPFSCFGSDVCEILNFLDTVKDYGGSLMKPHSSWKANTSSVWIPWSLLYVKTVWIKFSFSDGYSKTCSSKEPWHN